MTETEIVELHKRIRAEATGLTLAEVENACAAAYRVAERPGSTDEEWATYEEWYGIGYAMQPENGGLTFAGMDRYDPAKDGRPL
jgi:hypothetical protein